MGMLKCTEISTVKVACEIKFKGLCADSWDGMKH